jgi:hypothetical protein
MPRNCLREIGHQRGSDGRPIDRVAAASVGRDDLTRRFSITSCRGHEAAGASRRLQNITRDFDPSFFAGWLR